MTDRERLIRLRVDRDAYSRKPDDPVSVALLGRTSAEDDVRWLLAELDDLRDQLRQADA